jgi:hypothetical protein
VIRNCYFSKGSSSSNLSKINIQAEEIPVLIDNCSIGGGKYNVGSYNEITISGYQATIRNLKWNPSYGNSTLISTSCNVFVDNIWYSANYDTKTIFNIASSSAYVIVSGVKGNIFNGTLNLVSGYTNNLIKFDDYMTFGTTPGETVISLTVERVTTSTTLVTLKKFRVNFSGTVKISALYGVEAGDTEVYLRILKNGSTQYNENTASQKVWSNEVSISCSRGDLFEIQGAKEKTGTPMHLYAVLVKFTPKRSGDIYDVVD